MFLRQLLLPTIFSAALLSSQTLGASFLAELVAEAEEALSEPPRALFRPVAVPVADSAAITHAVSELHSLVTAETPHDPFSSPDIYQRAAKLQDKIYRHRLSVKDGEPTPMHVWFDAIAKTELGAAVPLMMSLAKLGISVTYTPGGGFFIKPSEGQAPPTAYIEGTNVPVELEPWKASPIRDQHTEDFSTGHFYIPPSEEGLDDGSEPVIPGYDVWHFQGPDAKQIAKLRKAGVRVLIKKQAPPHMEAQLESQKGRENSSREWWFRKVFPGAFSETPENVVLPAPSFLTVDALCHAPWHSQELSDIMSRPSRNAFGLLGVGAGLPGATWCGNTGLMQCGRVQAEAMNQRFVGCMHQGGLMEFTQEEGAWWDEDRMKFAGLDQRPVFVANCLGWHEGSKDMLGRLPDKDFQGYVRTLTKPGAAARIDTIMVSQLQENGDRKRDPGQEPAGADDPDIRKIHEKLAEQGADMLVFIAFGTQGFDFAREALEQILVNAAAVERSLVYLVLPTGWSIEETPPSGDIVFMSTASGMNKPVTSIIRGSDPQSRIVLADNMIAVPFPAPQPKIFEVFSPLSQDRVKMVFISHGGAGSIAEAVGRRVPILGLGLALDQPGNCAEVAGYGLGLDLRRLAHHFRVNHNLIDSPGGLGSCIGDVFSYVEDQEYRQNLLSPAEYQEKVSTQTNDARVSATERLVAMAAQKQQNPFFDIFTSIAYIRQHWEQFQGNFARAEKTIANNTMHNGETLTKHFIRILKETTRARVEQRHGQDVSDTSSEASWWSCLSHEKVERPTPTTSAGPSTPTSGAARSLRGLIEDHGDLTDETDEQDEQEIDSVFLDLMQSLRLQEQLPATTSREAPRSGPLPTTSREVAPSTILSSRRGAESALPREDQRASPTCEVASPTMTITAEPDVPEEDLEELKRGLQAKLDSMDIDMHHLAGKTKVGPTGPPMPTTAPEEEHVPAPPKLKPDAHAQERQPAPKSKAELTAQHARKSRNISVGDLIHKAVHRTNTTRAPDSHLSDAQRQAAQDAFQRDADAVGRSARMRLRQPTGSLQQQTGARRPRV